MIDEAAPRPCVSCPYRRDVPSGIWHPDEYRKLPHYDEETASQPIGVFLCHQGNQRICSGWLGCHDAYGLLSLRVAASMGAISPAVLRAALAYVCRVPLWASGREAADHGLRDVAAPDEAARRTMDRIVRKRKST